KRAKRLGQADGVKRWKYGRRNSLHGYIPSRAFCNDCRASLRQAYERAFNSVRNSYHPVRRHR
ncbi:MAG: hypothetical protein PHT33_13695, partial [bacterium]|nr:hypothetical protein [bacterium]